MTVTASGAEVPEGGNYKDRIVYENGTLTITSKPLPPAKYTITVQAGTGGTASASPTSAEKGTKITLNATPDGGYHFKEWQVISGGVAISNNSFTMPAANVTVKAMFEKDGGTTPPQPAEYSVTFDGNGGTSPAAQTTTGGKLTNLPTSTQSGYSFNGWYTAKTGGDKITLDTIFTSSVTVYAHWTKDSSGGSSGGGNGNSGGSSSGGGSSSDGGSSSGDNGSSDGSTIVARPDETKPDTPTTSQTKPAAPGHKVKKPSVPEVRSFRAKPGKKKLAFSWKKVPGAAGFQIQISTKKGFKGAKTISVSKSNKTYTKKGLKTKKKYYIRIRAYKTYLDKNKKTKKVYGKWIRISKKTR